MSFRKLNALQAIVWALVTVAMIALWIAADTFNFIGSTVFIGHISMGALVLSAGAGCAAAVGAWRSDVPTDEEN